MNLFKLLDTAKTRLEDSDPIFNYKTDLVMAILRSKEAIPFKRSKLNGGLHRLMSATIVSAFDAGTTIDVTTRRAGTLHEAGHSTKVLDYLDSMVKHKLVLSQTNQAQGRLMLGGIFNTYLDHSLAA